MKLQPFQTLKHYNKKNLPKDILAGIIIMAVSIPISMGYAQIAGLPAVYGLYGSVFPIILFGLFSTSPQFIFGVDAAPAALVGSAIVGLGIEGGTKEAMAAVPVLTFCVALWLLAFYFMKAGKLVNFISAPVMGGFITGICTTIILMQVPKLMGGTAGVGELLELAEHIAETVKTINLTCDRTYRTFHSSGFKKINSQISDGSCIDGSRSIDDTVFTGQGVGRTDACSSRTRHSRMEHTGFYIDRTEGRNHHQPVSCGCHYGGNFIGREQFCTEKRLQDR